MTKKIFFLILILTANNFVKGQGIPSFDEFEVLHKTKTTKF